MKLVVLAYDGSDDSRRAIDVAGKLIGGNAVVVHAWAPAPLPVAGALPVGAALTAAELEAARMEAERAAQRIVGEGVELARAAGFEPLAELRHGATGRDVWHAILDAAEEHDADLIVLGRHEASPIKTLLLGSVADGTVHHAHRPVLIVPSP